MAQERFSYYIQRAVDDGGLFFQQSLREDQWTKADLRVDFPNEALWNSGQLLGGIMLLSNSEKAMSFLNSTAELIEEDSFARLHDPLSAIQEVAGFRGHRHDQSVISLSAKHSEFAIIPDETYFAPHWESHGTNYPIWATRLCSGRPDLSTRLTSRILREVERRLIF
jgi:hypothetical protein